MVSLTKVSIKFSPKRCGDDYYTEQFIFRLSIPNTRSTPYNVKLVNFCLLIRTCNATRVFGFSAGNYRCFCCHRRMCAADRHFCAPQPYANWPEECFALDSFLDLRVAGVCGFPLFPSRQRSCQPVPDRLCPRASLID